MVCPCLCFFPSIWRLEVEGWVEGCQYCQLWEDLTLRIKKLKLAVNINSNQSFVFYSIHSRESVLEVKATEIKPILKKIFNPRGRAM